MLGLLIKMPSIPRHMCVPPLEVLVLVTLIFVSILILPLASHPHHPERSVDMLI